MKKKMVRPRVTGSKDVIDCLEMAIDLAETWATYLLKNQRPHGDEQTHVDRTKICECLCAIEMLVRASLGQDPTTMPKRRRLLAQIQIRGWEGDTSGLTTAELAAELGVSETRARVICRELQEKGLIERTP